MAENRWPEVEQAFQEKRHELVLSGPNISERIDKDGLDESIYRMKNLNFLEICKSTLEILSEDLGNLKNLTNLVLHSNQIKIVPCNLGKLSNLKLLDLSRNEIEVLPDDIGQLASLHTMNVSSNKLSALPNIGDLTNLHVVNFSDNAFEEFPDGLYSEKLTLLNAIIANNNEIVSLSGEINSLPSLKILDLDDNKLTEAPPELSECVKLKELSLKGNKFKDRRFGKLVDQCLAKSVLDYLAKIQKEREKVTGGRGGKGKKGRKAKKSESDDLSKDEIHIVHIKDETGLAVRVMDDVAKVRPFIVCCILRNLNFNKTASMFKTFISLQTKLHDDPQKCNKRQAATIATHDLKAVKGPLTLDARKPSDIKLMPLSRSKEISADRLVGKLRHEAEEVRKEKKRNTVSGVHKYLDLLKDKPEYPCLVDSSGEVISFPPITNSEVTKISTETTDILIEVTSSLNLDICKKVMDELLYQTLDSGVGSAVKQEVAATSPESDNNAGAAGGEPSEPEKSTDSGVKSLVVEQVKIVNQEGGLKVLYPSRVDLQSETYNVIREG